MKINTVSRKLIKPRTPTPQNLNKYYISFTDEDVPQMNVGIILFYNPILSNDNPNRSHIDRLEESLSEILPKFYPLAGRYMKNDKFVECSDQGAEFLQAEALDVELTDILAGADELLNDLFPSKFYNVNESPRDPLLWIQVTEFKCGGLAVSVTVSHRIFDGSSLGTFIAAWSNTNNNNNNNIINISPSFDSPSLFPCKMNPGPTPEEDLRVVVKRLSFSKEAIASLRSKLINKSTKPTTKSISRVRVVCAVLAQALIGVDHRAKQGGKSRPCIITQAVNVRGRTIPPLPKHSCGNMSMLSLTRSISSANDEEIGLLELVGVLGEGLDKTVADCAEIFSPSNAAYAVLVEPLTNLFEIFSKGEVNVIMFSDWSKFGFNEVDFGWGEKPVGAAIGAVPAENLTVLMDNKDGDGLEAWVHLNANDVPYFDQQIELLSTNVHSSSIVYDLLFQWKDLS